MVAAYSRKYGSDNRSIVAERLNSVVMLCGSRVARRLKQLRERLGYCHTKDLDFFLSHGTCMLIAKGRTIRKLMGGGGGGRNTKKKIRAREN